MKQFLSVGTNWICTTTQKVQSDIRILVERKVLRLELQFLKGCTDNADKFADKLNFQKVKCPQTLANAGGSAGARTPDYLIKSEITTVNHNNAQLIKDVISVRCVINNKLQYCTYLLSSATNLQHYRPYHPLRGTPLLRYLERETQSPQKKIQLT